MDKISINKRFIIAVNYLVSDKKVLNKSEISEKLNISKSKFSEILNERMGIGVDLLAIFCEKFSVNSNWLLTGQEPMLKSQVKEDKIIAERITDFSIKIESDLIPIASISAVAGFGGGGFSINQQDIEDYCKIPIFKGLKIDFMLPVSGSSMYPTYRNGDLVACRLINNRDFIQWGKTYVIATREQGILLKKLFKGEKEGCLNAVSDNKEYPPFDIPESEITGIAIVVGGVCVE